MLMQLKPSMLQSCLMAGMNAVFSLITRFTKNLIAEGEVKLGRYPKTMLQERLHTQKMALPKYDVVTRSVAPERLFTVSCHIAGSGITSYGKGCNKKAAEADAAQNAFLVLDGKI